MADRDDERAAAAEARHDLFEMIANLAALANARNEKALAVMLTAVVTAYR